MRAWWGVLVEERADVGLLQVVKEALPGPGGGDRLVAVTTDEELGAEVGFQAPDLQVEVLQWWPSAAAAVFMLW
jgi:hypothetical protein